MAIINRDGHQIDIDLLGLEVNHELNPAGASARTTVVFTSRIIRIVTAVAIHIKFGDSTVTAALTDPLMPANTIEYFDRLGNEYLAVLGTGEVHATEMV